MNDTLSTLDFKSVGSITFTEDGPLISLTSTLSRGVVYAYTDSFGKVLYIGSTSGCAAKRARAHWAALKDPNHGGKVYNKRTPRWMEILKAHGKLELFERKSAETSFAGIPVCLNKTEESALISKLNPVLNVSV
jgi:hypothetical protein